MWLIKSNGLYQILLGGQAKRQQTREPRREVPGGFGRSSLSRKVGVRVQLTEGLHLSGERDVDGDAASK